ncbi:MAG: SlyX family protein [Gammaproteobacteria bacterium]|jgi:SlyX protein
MTDPARLEALEMRIAHLERAVQELSEEFYRQQRDIDRLRQRNQQLLAEIEGGAAGTSRTDPEPPPHY